jgi:hypothetical protein
MVWSIPNLTLVLQAHLIELLLRRKGGQEAILDALRAGARSYLPELLIMLTLPCVR